jgi:hypothetical protein
MAIPIPPTITGLGAVILVRIVLWSKKQSIKWNLCIIGLAIMATFVTLEGDESSTFYGFWVGITYGGMGQGIINLGKSTMMGAIKDRFGKAVEAFMGTKPEDTKPDPE